MLQRDQLHITAWQADSSMRIATTASVPPSRADVCVIGAGIAGLSCAYHLAKAGKRVVVLDDGRIAQGQTARTTAHLASACDDRYYEMERIHGESGIKTIAESHSQAIDSIERIAIEEKIECDFVRLDGYLFLGPEDTREILERELTASLKAGMSGVELIEAFSVGQAAVGPALRFPRQGQFHPLKYLQGLSEAIVRRGGTICTGKHASKITDGEPCVVEIGDYGEQIIADQVIVATNSPINDLLAIHTKQAPYISYVVAGRVPKGSVKQALYWDTLDPYHYVRLNPLPTESAVDADAYDLLIVGGEDHKTGQADDHDRRYDALRKWALQRFPGFQALDYQWSGQVFEPVDGVAFIGRNFEQKHVYIVTGDSGQGMTHGAMSGIILTDLILGRDNPWAKLYDPSRKSLSSALEFAKENLNVAMQYGAWLTGGDTTSLDAIEPGQGAVVRSGLEKHAVYRDDQGQLHTMTAVCPHLQGIVQWNRDERTWDCPCHGSRFDCLGGVIIGPANKDLEVIQPPAAAVAEPTQA